MDQYRFSRLQLYRSQFHFSDTVLHSIRMASCIACEAAASVGIAPGLSRPISIRRRVRCTNEEFVMAQAGNNDSRFGGEFLIQDSDHMSGISPSPRTVQHGGTRQSEQSQSRGHKQRGTEHHSGGQQGGERKSKRR
jgi:hypothetical protein